MAQQCAENQASVTVTNGRYFDARCAIDKKKRCITIVQSRTVFILIIAGYLGGFGIPKHHPASGIATFLRGHYCN